MAHVEIKPNAEGGSHVIVDGVDIGNHVLADGFAIHPNDNLGFTVSLTIFARTLDADLPESVIEALRSEGGES